MGEPFAQEARQELWEGGHLLIAYPSFAHVIFTPENFTDWEAAVKHVNNLTAEKGSTHGLE